MMEGWRGGWMEAFTIFPSLKCGGAMFFMLRKKT